VTAALLPDTRRSFDRRAQLGAMSRRSIIAIIRQPALVVPSLIFPLFFAALGSSSFSRATQLPGFPEVDSFLDFALAGAIIQGVLFGSVTSAASLATDIENGFFDRLLTTPSSRSSIVVGRLAGGMTYGAFQTIFFTAVLIPFGLTVKSGLIGFVVMVASGAIVALAVGGLMGAMAIRTGSSEAVQGAFPLLFIMMFFSSAFFPRETMSGLYGAIANLNPVSYIVEGIRALVIDELSVRAVAQAVVLPAVLALLTLQLSLRTLRRRIAAR
jgi:ABC-2 type transport system permease protein